MTSHRTTELRSADAPASSEHVDLDGRRVTINRLSFEDDVVAELLRSHPRHEWATVIQRAVVVGARGITAMGIGVTLSDVEREIERAFASVSEQAEGQVARLLAAGEETLSAQLDPDLRTSLTSRAIDQLAAIRTGLLADLDPDRAGSHTAVLLQRLADTMGEGGELERRLAAALDVNAPGSGHAALHETVATEIRELRDLLMREAGRSIEAERGTAKGGDYEEVVDAMLRGAVGGLGGWTVERTSTTPGALGANAVVGDFVLTLPDGQRIVVEAKNVARLSLTGRDGVLAELDRAMTNRGAEHAICVSARDAFPGEVGSFAVHGNRVLVVDEGDGGLIRVALSWTRAALEATRRGDAGRLDSDFVLGRLERIRDLAGHFSRSKRSLSSVRSGIDAVRNDLEGMRVELLDLVAEMAAEISRAAAPREGDTRGVA